MISKNLLDDRKDPLNLGMDLPDGHLTVEDQELLYEYSKGTDLVVEIGTFFGRSAIIMAHNARQLYSIDLYGEQRTKKYPELTYENMLKRMEKYKNIGLLKGCSWLMANFFNDKTIDLLFVDGDHSKMGVSNDFREFWPKMKKDGIIIFHDYKLMVGKYASKAVKPAVDCIIEEYKDQIEERNMTGWCKVIKKNV